MGGTGRHAMSAPSRFAPREKARRAQGERRIPTRLGVTAAVSTLVAVLGIIVAVAVANPADTGPADTAPAGKAPAGTGSAGKAPAGTGSAGARPAAQLAPVPSARANASPAMIATMPLALTAADHQDCPAAAAACVDLTRHITWLQANGVITFGPVQMEPGQPGGGHQTPRGTFQVSWKGGPSLVSNIYDEPMPWATFFAPGGIAFHGGSLTEWSHGCVHLTVPNAHYYNEHLPIGAEVVVF